MAKKDPVERTILTIIGLLVVILLGALGGSIYDRHTWPDYADSHGCKPTDERTNSKELWICRDGARHWRSL